jgi:8-oxo-dGTP diphosphatase
MTTRVVVGAAIVRDGRVLAARRSAPPELAGRWEFPGGKVEDGESDLAALVRECREELGVSAEIGDLLAETPISDGLVLRVHVVELIAGVPKPLEDHDKLRWLAATDLDSVDWLPADLPVLVRVRPYLR